MTENSYFRALSLNEFQNWKSQRRIDAGKYWTSQKLSYLGYPLEELKRWVDAGKNEFGLQDLVIQVDSSRGLEFDLEIRESGFPPRYINYCPINFERVNIVYDPRAIVSPTAILVLEEMIRTPSFFEEIKKINTKLKHFLFKK